MRRTLCALVLGLFLVAGLAPAVSAQEAPPPEPVQPVAPEPAPEEPPAPEQPPVPANSGEGRRIVYSNGQQRIWLVEHDGTVAKTHLVSGKRNYPRPGNYAVFSKSPTARSRSGLYMQYMVRWARTSRLPVGFHSIPTTRSGRPIQSLSELGSYRSIGCVRQSVEDAAFLWDWAPLRTPVVVTR